MYLCIAINYTEHRKDEIEEHDTALLKELKLAK